MFQNPFDPRKICPLFAIALYFFTSLAFAQHSWTRTNPGGGGSTSMMGATANGAALVIGSDLSGVYISTDNGNQWKPLGANNGLTATDATALGFHTWYGDTFFVGTGSGLFKTSTGGDTFQKVLPNAANPWPVEFIESIVVSKSNPDTIYVAQHRWAPALPSSIYKSWDHGSNWQPVAMVGLPSDQNIVKLLVHPADPNVLYALTGRSRFACSTARLYRSTNGGNNWSRVGSAEGDVLDMDVHPTNTNIVFMSTFEANDCPTNSDENYTYIGGDVNSGAFFKSTNGGSSFTQLSDKTGIISVGSQNPQKIRLVDVLYPYDWNPNAGTWESLSGGQSGTWTHTGLVTQWFPGYSKNQYYTFNQSFYGLTKTVTKDIFNDDRMYGTFGGWAWASFDGGKHLNNVATKSVGSGWRSTGMENINGHALDVSDANPDVVYMGGYDIGFWTSLDHGGSFRRTQPDFNVYSDYVWNIGTIPVDPALATSGEGANISTLLNDPARSAVVWASFSRGQYSDESRGVITKTGLFKSSASGQGWQWAGNGLPAGDNAIRIYGLSVDITSPVNNRTLYVTVKGDVYKSVNDGTSWTLALAPPGHGLKFTAVDKFNGNLVYAGGEEGLWRSVDAGANWSEVGGAVMRASASHTPMRKDIVPTGSLKDWSNGGQITLYPWEGVFDVKTDPNVANRVYATVYGEGRGLFRSDNAGQTWTKLLSDDHMRGVAIAPQDSNLIYVTSSESYHSGASNNSRGFRFSDNAGGTWQDANEGLAWNYGGMIEVATGSNPDVWAWAPGTGVQFSAAAVSNGVPPRATLISPSGATSDTTPTYRWNAVSGSSWYRLWVDDSGGNAIKKWYSAAEAGCSDGIGECAVTPVTELAGGSGRWWIQTWNNSGSGPWSDRKDINIAGSPPAAVTLVSPSGNISDSTPVYRWNAVAQASWYYLWVNDASGNVIKKWYTATDAGCGGSAGVCTITPTTALASGNGRWWVRSWNTNGNGDWSGSLSFLLN